MTLAFPKVLRLASDISRLTFSENSGFRISGLTTSEAVMIWLLNISWKHARLKGWIIALQMKEICQSYTFIRGTLSWIFLFLYSTPIFPLLFFPFFSSVYLFFIYFFFSIRSLFPLINSLLIHSLSLSQSPFQFYFGGKSVKYYWIMGWDRLKHAIHDIKKILYVYLFNFI